MNRDPRSSSAPSQDQAAAFPAGHGNPFCPSGNPGMPDRAEAGVRSGTVFTNNQHAEASWLVDGWNFRLLV